MNKGVLFFFSVWFMVSAPLGYAQGMAAAEKRPLQRAAEVNRRGFINFWSLGVEIPKTYDLERKTHPRLWPLSAVPRTMNNLIVRLTSAVTDFAFMPWVAMVSDDTPPLTEPLGLPEYPWQGEGT